jgi:hypothetical protein
MGGVNEHTNMALFTPSQQSIFVAGMNESIE